MGDGEDMGGGDEGAETGGEEGAEMGGEEGAETGGEEGAEEGGSGDELDMIVETSVEETAELGGRTGEEDIVGGTCTGDDGDSKKQSAEGQEWGRAKGARLDYRLFFYKTEEWDKATPPRACADPTINGSGEASDGAPDVITPEMNLTYSTRPAERCGGARRPTRLRGRGELAHTRTGRGGACWRRSGEENWALLGICTQKSTPHVIHSGRFPHPPNLPG